MVTLNLLTNVHFSKFLRRRKNDVEIFLFTFFPKKIVSFLEMDPFSSLDCSNENEQSYVDSVQRLINSSENNSLSHSVSPNIPFISSDSEFISDTLEKVKYLLNNIFFIQNDILLSLSQNKSTSTKDIILISNDRFQVSIFLSIVNIGQLPLSGEEMRHFYSCRKKNKPNFSILYCSGGLQQEKMFLKPTDDSMIIGFKNQSLLVETLLKFALDGRLLKSRNESEIKYISQIQNSLVEMEKSFNENKKLQEQMFKKHSTMFNLFKQDLQQLNFHKINQHKLQHQPINIEEDDEDPVDAP